MLKYIAFSFLLKLCVVKSDVDFETMCKNDYRHIVNNTQIDVSKLCSSNTCIEKCCVEGEMFNPRGHCTNTIAMFQRFKKVSTLISDVDYSKIVLFSWDGSVKKKSKQNFVFVKNQRNVANCTSEQWILNDFFILEDGAVMMQDTGATNSWSVIKNLEYCLDFKLTVIQRRPLVKLVVREYNADPADRDILMIFQLVVLLVSSFFLLVVLAVYCLLPKLQNLMGLVLIAYTLSILVTNLTKIALQLTVVELTVRKCKIISPMMYFTAVSSVFWMNVTSFDIWWLLRGHCKRCDSNRRGERVKFMWCCLYAWGIPLLMTAIVTTLDNIDLSNLHITKPPFDNCFVYWTSTLLYFYIPIGLIVSVNITLFSLTVYNLWMTRRAVNKYQDSTSIPQDTNRFVTYLKLSVVMGVSLFVEIIPTIFLPFGWFNYVTAMYNQLIGVFLFFLFVFNKRIFFKLCKRLNININMSPRESRLRNGTSGTTRVATKDQTHEMDLFKDRSKGENIEVSNAHAFT